MKLEKLDLLHPRDLIPLLGSPDEKLAAQACIELRQRRRKSDMPALLAVLEGDRASLWKPAGRSISMLESKRAVRPLIRLMLDIERPSPQRQAAAYALAFTWSAFGDARLGPLAGEAFLTVLKNRSEESGLRGQAAEGLAYRYGPCAGSKQDRRRSEFRQAGEILMDMLGDPSAEVRFWCVFALGSMRYRPALPLLRKLARRDKESFGNWWSVGEEARDAVERISQR
jgi:HEAT repeat protein